MSGKMSERMVMRRAGSGSVTYPARAAHQCVFPPAQGFPYGAIFSCDCGKEARLDVDSRGDSFWVTK